MTNFKEADSRKERSNMLDPKPTEQFVSNKETQFGSKQIIWHEKSSSINQQAIILEYKVNTFSS